MKLFAIVFVAAFAVSTVAVAKGGHRSSSHGQSGSHKVRGHITKKGVIVTPTRATNPNHTRIDNYSHKGNSNPYNGKEGTKD